MRAGTIQQLWRYPVKSMGGERIDTAEVTANGFVGDRTWAVRDTGAGETVSAKRIPALLTCSARTVGPPGEDGAFQVEVTLPGGETLTTSDLPAANDALSELCRRPVTLEPLRPATDLEFYRHGKRSGGAPAVTIQEVMGIEEGDAFPDFSSLPRLLTEFSTPPGTFFDAYPLHIVTTASYAEVQQLGPEAHYDIRRFRPNILIETPPDLMGFAEFDWVGQQLTIGAVSIDVHVPCLRCSMVMAAQPGLERDRAALRTLVDYTARDFGVYCNVLKGGTLTIGDAVSLD